MSWDGADSKKLPFQLDQTDTGRYRTMSIFEMIYAVYDTGIQNLDPIIIFVQVINIESARSMFWFLCSSI